MTQSPIVFAIVKVNPTFFFESCMFIALIENDQAQMKTQIIVGTNGIKRDLKHEEVTLSGLLC